MSTLYYESKLAKSLGISRPEFKKLRKSLLEFEADWQMHGNQVVITEAGIVKLASHFEGGAVFAEVPEAKVDYHPPTGEVELIVRQVYPNPRLLLCVFPVEQSKEQVRVRVPRNDNFRPKMMIKASKLSDGFYELVGRCPRYPGRW